MREPGATHVTVLIGAALEPAGDLIEADAAREAADGLLDELRALGIGPGGGMTLAAINTTLSDSADVAQEAAPGDTADALIWHELVARTGEESRLSISILAFLTIACGLATVGVLTGSPATGDDRAGGRLRLCGGRCGAVPAGRRSHCSSCW